MGTTLLLVTEEEVGLRSRSITISEILMMHVCGNRSRVELCGHRADMMCSPDLCPILWTCLPLQCAVAMDLATGSVMVSCVTFCIQACFLPTKDRQR